jgi:hypothetical protein
MRFYLIGWIFSFLGFTGLSIPRGPSFEGPLPMIEKKGRGNHRACNRAA